jgi:hypothetical protein
MQGRCKVKRVPTFAARDRRGLHPSERPAPGVALAGNQATSLTRRNPCTQPEILQAAPVTNLRCLVRVSFSWGSCAGLHPLCSGRVQAARQDRAFGGPDFPELELVPLIYTLLVRRLAEDLQDRPRLRRRAVRSITRCDSAWRTLIDSVTSSGAPAALYRYWCCSKRGAYAGDLVCTQSYKYARRRLLN